MTMPHEDIKQANFYSALKNDWFCHYCGNNTKYHELHGCVETYDSAMMLEDDDFLEVTSYDDA